jgi:hypothetical protein
MKKTTGDFLLMPCCIISLKKGGSFMDKIMKNNTLGSVVLFALAFILYLAFCITFTVNFGASVVQWLIFVFILVFGGLFFLGLLTKKIGNLSKYALVVLVVGNVVISMVQDPAHLFALSSNNPAYLNASYILTGIAGVFAFLNLVLLLIAYSLPVLGVLLKKIARYAFIGIAVFYLGAAICYNWAGNQSWLMLGLLTAYCVYFAFYFAIPAVDNKQLNA